MVFGGILSFGALTFLIKYNTSWSLIPHGFTPLEETTSGLFVIIWSMMEHGITKREATPPFPPKFYMNQIIEWYLQTG